MRVRSGLLYEFCEPSSVVTRRLGARVAVLECTGRVYTVNISMNLRCARWSLMAPQTDPRRGMRFRSVLSLSPSWGDAGDREITADEISSLEAHREIGCFYAWTTVSRLSVNKHFIRRSDVENSNRSRETRVRFNLDGFRRYQRYFKCKLIDLSGPSGLPPTVPTIAREWHEFTAPIYFAARTKARKTTHWFVYICETGKKWKFF